MQWTRCDGRLILFYIQHFEQAIVRRRSTICGRAVHMPSASRRCHSRTHTWPSRRSRRPQRSASRRCPQLPDSRTRRSWWHAPATPSRWQTDAEDPAMNPTPLSPGITLTTEPARAQQSACRVGAVHNPHTVSENRRGGLRVTSAATRPLQCTRPAVQVGGAGGDRRPAGGRVPPGHVPAGRRRRGGRPDAGAECCLRPWQ